MVENNGTQSTTKNNNNTNGRRTLTMYLSLLISIVALGKTIFFAGGNEARMEEHMHYIDQRLDRDEREFARIDVLEPQIAMLRETIRKEENNVESILRLTQTLETRLERK